MSWLDKDKLVGFDKTVYEVLAKKTFMDEERKSAISMKVKSRIEKVIKRHDTLNRNIK